MTSEGAELDLYADDVDEFSQENEYNDSDLYDDVITSNTKSRGMNNSGSNIKTEETSFNGTSGQNQSSSSSLLPTSSGSTESGISFSGSKKPCIYVGNLTWWTTDEDVSRALASIGVNDVVEIKFFENRANGQSKGFCVVTLQMESSVRTAIEKLAKVELYGQTCAVTMCNRQNLNNFEMKSRKPGQNGAPTTQSNNNSTGFVPNNRNFGQNPAMPQLNNTRPPLLPRGPTLGRPNNGPLLTNQPRLPQLSHNPLAFGVNNHQQWPQLLPNGPRPLHSGGGPTLNPILRMPQGNRNLNNQPILLGPNSQADLQQLPQVQLGAVGQHALANAHNPLFGSQQSIVSSNSQDRFGLNPFGPGRGNDFARHGIDMVQMSDAEYEELIKKNKNLATNSIQRAVADASSGDYSTAIDTLATAISLISESRVAHDEQCKAVISSLKDTLQSIEANAYSSGGDRGRKERPRSRERSRERSSRREKSRRERSRSRDYRERSRDRHYDDRHYDDRDRYREKDSHRERERDRDHRSRH